MEDQLDMPQEDSIDVALLNLMEKISGDDSDEEMDQASDIVFDIAEDLVDDGAMDDIPENDASDEEKSLWLEKCYPILEKAVLDEVGEDAPIVPEG